MAFRACPDDISVGEKQIFIRIEHLLDRAAVDVSVASMPDTSIRKKFDFLQSVLCKSYQIQSEIRKILLMLPVNPIDKFLGVMSWVWALSMIAVPWASSAQTQMQSCP